MMCWLDYNKNLNTCRCKLSLCVNETLMKKSYFSTNKTRHIMKLETYILTVKAIITKNLLNKSALEIYTISRFSVNTL